MRKSLLPLVLLFMLACNLPAVTISLTQPAAQEENPSPTALVPAAASVTPLEAVAVPMTVLQMDGGSYQVYQMPGDPFRFVCQEPCKGDVAVIQAQYGAFRNAREKLVQIMGVDTRPELQPVDIHLTDDSLCGVYEEAIALSFANRIPNSHAYVCTFIFEYTDENYTPARAGELVGQLIFIHEYLHTIFFGRVPFRVDAMHDFVTPLSEYVAYDMQSDEELCTYFPGRNPGDFDGSLLKNLCAQNGFGIAHVSALMTELDRLIQSGAGQLQEQGYAYLVPSMLQFRDVLNNVLGGDTTAAFAEACWPPEYLGNVYSLPPACLVQPVVITPTPIK